MDDRPAYDELLAENAELKRRVAELEAQVSFVGWVGRGLLGYAGWLTQPADLVVMRRT